MIQRFEVCTAVGGEVNTARLNFSIARPFVEYVHAGFNTQSVKDNLSKGAFSPKWRFITTITKDMQRHHSLINNTQDVISSVPSSYNEDVPETLNFDLCRSTISHRSTVSLSIISFTAVHLNSDHLNTHRSVNQTLERENSMLSYTLMDSPSHAVTLTGVSDECGKKHLELDQGYGKLSDCPTEVNMINESWSEESSAVEGGTLRKEFNDFRECLSYNDIRPIFEKVWDFNQNIEPMDAEHGSGKQKSPEKSPEKMKSAEKMEEDDVAKETGVKRKKSIPRKSTRKRQKLEEDAEKEELKEFLDIIPREEVPIEVESISTKFPIVDWKTCVLTETFMYYQVFRGDGSSKNYKILSEMLEDFDRLDVEELYRLVKNRYSASRPEGFDLMLWGDLHTLFEPDEDDEIWKDQHEYNLLSWRLYDFCGIYILLMENGLAIHMKKYPLSQEMISKMLKKKLEVDHESSQAIELLRFIRSQMQK
ncbi:hypothetical protein Tco_0424943 [Tanacetum coccineum]